MSKVEILKQETLLGKDFNIYGDFENPLFLAKDVAEWIEHSNPTEMVRGVDEDEKQVILIPSKQSLVGLQPNTQYTFLTEEGVYEVLMQSRKPIAKKFKKGVKNILKTIRTTGSFTARFQLPQSYSEALRELADKTDENEKLKMIAVANAPKVLFADAIVASDNSVLIGKLANVLKQNAIDIGQNRLFKWLRENGYLCKYGERYNQPTQKSMELELFEVSYNTVVRADKSIQTITTKVTGKGQVYLINKFLDKKDIA